MKVEFHADMALLVVGFAYFPAGTFTELDEEVTAGEITVGQERFVFHPLPFVSVHFIWEKKPPCKLTSSNSTA